MMDSARQHAVFLLVEHTARKHSDDVHIWIRGELDIATHGQLQTALSNIPLAHAAAVTLHLSELTFCDARGACLLLRYGQQARDRGLHASIDNPTRPARRILQLIDPDTTLIA